MSGIVVAPIAAFQWPEWVIWSGDSSDDLGRKPALSAVEGDLRLLFLFPRQSVQSCAGFFEQEASFGFLLFEAFDDVRRGLG